MSKSPTSSPGIRIKVSDKKLLKVHKTRITENKYFPIILRSIECKKAEELEIKFNVQSSLIVTHDTLFALE